VTWEMRIEAGNPKLEATQTLPDFPYARYADLLGLQGIRVDRPDDVGAAWEAALVSDRPVIFEAYTSGDVPTLPPHISIEQAKNYMSALLKGDPDEVNIIKQSIKGIAKGVLPQKG
jgi:pyruvate dehydrogenase (quinone)